MRTGKELYINEVTGLTVKELKQYRSICAEIDELNIRLKGKEVYGTVRASDSDFPYTQHTIGISGVTADSGNRRLLSRLAWLRRRKEEIDDFIDGIEDSLTRRIFIHRYIEGDRRPSWQAIAFRIGEHDESYPRKKHNKYLKLAENAENHMI